METIRLRLRILGSLRWNSVLKIPMHDRNALIDIRWKSIPIRPLDGHSNVLIDQLTGWKVHSKCARLIIHDSSATRWWMVIGCCGWHPIFNSPSQPKLLKLVQPWLDSFWDNNGTDFDDSSQVDIYIDTHRRKRTSRSTKDERYFNCSFELIPL